MKVSSSLAVLLLVSVSASAQLMSSHASPASKARTQASAPAPQVTNKPVARVNGAVITDRDLVRVEYEIFPYARQHGGLPKSMEPEVRKGALDMLVFEELAYQEALRRNYTIPESSINNGEAMLKQRFPSQKDFQTYLSIEFKGSRQLFRQRIRRSMLIDKLLKLEVNNKANVTAAEAKAYYAKNPQKFVVPESFQFQSISILAPANATPAQLADVKKRAEEAYAKAKVTKSYEEFGLLAEKISEDDFRVNMGDHKNATKDTMPAEFLREAAKMKIGEVSPLLQFGTSYTIFRINAHQQPRPLKFEEVKKQLMIDLQKAKVTSMRAALGKRLRKGAKIETL